MSSCYSAVADRGLIKVYDVERGTRAYTINLGSEIIVNGPVVTGDILSVVSRETSGKVKGRVYSLKKGTIKYTFNVR